MRLPKNPGAEPEIVVIAAHGEIDSRRNRIAQFDLRVTDDRAGRDRQRWMYFVSNHWIDVEKEQSSFSRSIGEVDAVRPLQTKTVRSIDPETVRELGFFWRKS